MKSRLFVFLFVSYSVLWGQNFSEKRILRQLQKIEAFENAHIGISISPLEDSKPIASYQASKYMTPASNTKLLTFLGAQEQFDKLPALSYALERDSIIHFKSTGYPLLFHPFYKDTILDSFFNQKAYWNYHTSKIAPRPMGAGWAWDDYSYYYAAESSTFPIYGNVVEAKFIAQAIQTVPAFFESHTVLDSSAKAYSRIRKQNQFQYNPSKWIPGDTLYHPFITSDSLFVKLLSRQTNQKIEMFSDSSPQLQWNFLKTGQENTLFKALLQDSDNGIAEALLLMISQQNFNTMQPEKAIELLLQQWKPWLVDPIEWVDGSGISRYNMITPRTLVEVLKKIHQKVGWDTIKDYFSKGAPLEAFREDPSAVIYAKTGTLRHNFNLSGYLVLPEGKAYVFSIMVNHHNRSTAEVRKGIGVLLKWFERRLR